MLFRWRTLLVFPHFLALVALSLLDILYADARLLRHNRVNTVPDRYGVLDDPRRRDSSISLDTVADEPSQNGFREGQSVAAIKPTFREKNGQ